MNNFDHVFKITTALEGEIKRQRQRYGYIKGIPTGLSSIDNLTGGFHNSELYLLAARPSMGKTAFMASLIYYTGIIEKIGTAIFCLEMSKMQLGQRILSMVSRTDSQAMRTGKFKGDDLARIGRANGILEKAPIYIDDTSALTLGELRVKLKRLSNKHEIGFVIVDYLQLMTGGKLHENRKLELVEIISGLKNIAVEYGIPVLVLTQLNRSTERRNNKRPLLSDIPDSFLECSDTIMFLYRDDDHYENENTADEVSVEVTVAKQKNGSGGNVKVRFLKSIATFEDDSLFS